MKPWQERYAGKRITACEAAALVHCGDVVRSSFGNPPVTVLDVLAARAGELEDVTLIQCFSGSALDPCNDARLGGSFRHIVDCVGPDRRAAPCQSVIDVLPLDDPHCGKQFEEGRTNNFAADVFFAVVSPPDRAPASGFVDRARAPRLPAAAPPRSAPPSLEWRREPEITCFASFARGC